jgi:hypothetical protein
MKAPEEFLRRAVARSINEILRGFRDEAPTLHSFLLELLEGRRPSGADPDYFLDSDRFPFLHLPFWVVGDFEDVGSEALFLADTVRSSVAGYYCIRLVDDLMDESDRFRLALLPVAQALQLGFVAPYRRHFPGDHPFWAFLDGTWIAAAESTARDHRMEEIGENEFRAVSARKVAAARIPTFAACSFAGMEHGAPEWLAFVDALGVFEQFMDDFFDWHRDYRRGRQTYFLSEGRRRSGSARGVVPWALGPGMGWAREKLYDYLVECRTRAKPLEREVIRRHLDAREARLESSLRDLSAGARDLLALREALGEEKD